MVHTLCHIAWQPLIVVTISTFTLVLRFKMSFSKVNFEWNPFFKKAKYLEEKSYLI